MNTATQSVVHSTERRLATVSGISAGVEELALHVTKLHTFADEPVLHTPLSTAPQGDSPPSAAPPLVSKKFALHVTELHTAAAKLRPPLERNSRNNTCQRAEPLQGYTHLSNASTATPGLVHH